MSQSAQPAQNSTRSAGIAFMKLALIAAALLALGFSFVTIDLPQRNWIWIAVEAAVTVLLLQSAVANLKRLFR